METSRLISREYWESPEIDLRLNPRRRFDTGGLVEFLRDDCRIDSAVVLATSGSSGPTKFVVLSRTALLHSARSVVSHSGLLREDVSLAGLSGFHVGGLGIYVRAYVTGSRVVEMDTNRWVRDGSALVSVIEREGVTLTSMTPTHLHDLVRHEVRSPDSLRLVFLGGGRMDSSLIERARDLGWPIRVSYGMTEAGSQVATSLDDACDWLPLLSHWEVREAVDGTGGVRLAIRGASLFSGYARKVDGAWEFDPGRDGDGWFVTGDQCELREGALRFLGRADDLVKISGELVSLAGINQLAASIARELGGDAAVVAIPDSRRENELVVVMEDGDAATFLQLLNRELDGIERVGRIVMVECLPRTEIGKLDQEALRRLAGA